MWLLALLRWLVFSLSRKPANFFSHCAAYSLHIADGVFVGQQTSNLDRTLNVM